MQVPWKVWLQAILENQKQTNTRLYIYDVCFPGLIAKDKSIEDTWLDAEKC